MSTEVIQTPGDGPPSPCEQLLDFAYGELDSEAQGAFERHLAGCARCQAELAAIERVRGAVRAVMPMVEPPSTTMEMGALHAQLLHAAAQRKPSGGGKVLEFKSPWKRVQKVVMHPAFAAAAVFVIVGGVVGLQWQRSVAPAPMMTAPAATPVTPAIAETTTTEKAAEKMPAAAEPVAATADAPKPDVGAQLGKLGTKGKYESVARMAKDSTALGGLEGGDIASSGKKTAPTAYRASKADKADDRSLNLQPALEAKPAAPPPVATPAPAPAANGAGDEGFYARREAKETAKPVVVAKPSPAPAKGGSVGGATSADDLAGLGRTDGTWNAQTRNWASPSTGTSTGNTGSGAPARRPAEPAPTAKVAAAPPPPTTTPAAPAETEQSRRRGATSSTLSTTPPAGASFSTSAPSQALAPQASQAMPPQQHVAQNQTQTRDVRGPSEGLLAKNADGMRKKADELARTGRCDEANQIYQQLEKTVAGFKLTVIERANLSHCRGQQGRMRTTQDELDSLKAEERQQQKSPARDKKQRMPQDPLFEDAEISAPPATAHPAPSAPAAEAPAPAPTSAPRKSKRAHEKAADSAY